MNRVKWLSVLAVFMFACKGEKTQQNSGSELLNQLKRVKTDGILFGHQDDLAYGKNWYYPNGESDVKRVAGDFPALFGWELGGLEMEHTHNLDSVSFCNMHDLAIKVNAMGGVNTFSWHPYSVIDSASSWSPESDVVKYIIPGGEYHEAFKLQLNKIVAFFTSLKDEKGNTIPFIFRPWHEMDGTWFWWGSKSCSADDFKKLFQFTVSYLREKGLSQMLVAYSPDRNFNTKQEYLQWYPGDEYVDILGMDNYHDLKVEGGVPHAIEKLHLLIDLANQKNKVAALTETGLENVTDSTWYNQKLGEVMADSIVSSNISYVMVWRNDPKVHFFFPYPNHNAAEGAKELLDKPQMFLLSDWNAFKITK